MGEMIAVGRAFAELRRFSKNAEIKRFLDWAAGKPECAETVRKYLGTVLRDYRASTAQKKRAILLAALRRSLESHDLTDSQRLRVEWELRSMPRARKVQSRPKTITRDQVQAFISGCPERRFALICELLVTSHSNPS